MEAACRFAYLVRQRCAQSLTLRKYGVLGSKGRFLKKASWLGQQRGLNECVQATRNDIGQDARVGCARRSWAPTTGSYRQRVWCLVSQLHVRLTATSWSQGSPAWWLGRCRWPPENTCRFTPRQTLNRLISRWSAWNSRQTTRASTRNWLQSTSLAGLMLCWRSTSPSSWWPTKTTVHMPATNSASPILSVRVRFRLLWHRPAALQSE